MQLSSLVCVCVCVRDRLEAAREFAFAFFVCLFVCAGQEPYQSSRGESGVENSLNLIVECVCMCTYMYTYINIAIWLSSKTYLGRQWSTVSVCVCVCVCVILCNTIALLVVKMRGIVLWHRISHAWKLREWDASPTDYNLALMKKMKEKDPCSKYIYYSENSVNSTWGCLTSLKVCV